MKSKNKKRIGPVPITMVAVFALAAFLSVGLLLATNGVQPVAAQSDDCEVAVSAAGAATLPVGGCVVQGDTATVVFQGVTAAADDKALTLLIEDTAGPITAYPAGTVWNTVLVPPGLADGAVADSNRADSMKYRFQSVTVPKAKADANTGIVEGQKVSVMAKGNVHIWAGNADVTGGIGNIPIADVASGALAIASGASELDITFVGAPVEKADVDDNAENDDVVTSALVLTASSPTPLDNVVGDGPIAGVLGAVREVTDLPDADTKVKISAEFNDENAQNVVGNIVFTIGTPSAGAEGVQFEGGGTVRTAFTSSVGSFEIIDIPKDIVVRIPVTATITGATGTLTLKGTIIRLGDATMVTAKAYACEMDAGDTNYTPATETAPAAVPAADLCTSEIKALKKSGTEGDPKEIGALQSGDIFTIYGEAVDMLGNKRPGSLTWKATPDTDTSDVLSASGDAETVITVGADDDQLGSYSITVESDDKEASTTITFAVSGEIKDYQIVGPAEIEIDGDGFASYEVTATDANGNPAAGINCVTVRVRGVEFDEDQDLSVPMIEDCDADATTEDTDLTRVGATFTIDAPPGIAAGTTATIQIRVEGEVKARTVITFVSMSVEPDPVTPPTSTLTAPSAVAVAVDDAGVPTVTWTAGDSATSQVLIVVNAADDTDYCLGLVAGDASSHTCTDALTSGATYVVLVIALDGQGGYMLGNIASITGS